MRGWNGLEVDDSSLQKWSQSIINNFLSFDSFIIILSCLQLKLSFGEHKSFPWSMINDLLSLLIPFPALCLFFIIIFILLCHHPSLPLESSSSFSLLVFTTPCLLVSFLLCFGHVFLNLSTNLTCLPCHERKMSVLSCQIHIHMSSGWQHEMRRSLRPGDPIQTAV